MIGNLVVNINRLISDKGMVKKAVAEKAGIPPVQFYSMTRGRKNILAEDIPKIASALGVTPNEIYGYKVS